MPPRSSALSKSALDVHRASLGGPALPFPFMDQSRQRVPMRDLLKRCNYWVHKCVTINSQVAATVPYKLYSTSSLAKGLTLNGKQCRPASNLVKGYLKGRTKLQPSTALAKAVRGGIDDLTEIPQHAALDLIEKPNGFTDGQALAHGEYADLHLCGRYFTHYTGDELWRIRPDICEVIPDEREFVKAFRIGGNGPNKKDLPTDEVLWGRMYDPTNDWGGLGPVEAWLRTIDASESIQAYWTWIFERGGAPDYVHKSDVLPDQKQRDAFMSQWNRFFSKLRNKLRNIAFIGGKGAELVRLGQTNKELEFGASADKVRDHIAAALGTPQSLLIQDIGARANAREADEQYVAYTIWPLVQLREAVLNEQLIHRHYSDQLILIHENPVPEDQAIRLEQHEGMLRTGSTIDEGRIANDQEPLGTPDAQVPLVAVGLTTLERLINPPEPAIGLGLGFSGQERTESAPTQDERTESAPLERARIAFELAKACHAGTLHRFAASGQLMALGYGEADIERMLGPAPIELPPPKPMLRLRRHVEPVSVSRIWHDMHAGKLNGWDRCAKAKPQQGLEVPAGLGVEIRAILSEQLLAVAAAMQVGQTAALEAMSDPEWPKRLVDALRGELEEVLAQGWQRGAARIGAVLTPPVVEAPVSKRQVPTPAFDVRNPAVQEFVDRYVIRLATEINGTTQVMLTDLIGKELAQGASAEKMAQAIRELDESVSGYRASMIARTESTRAAMAGQQESWRQSGVVQGKKWLLAQDACEFCQAAARDFGEKAVPVDQPFYQQGSVLQGTNGGAMSLDYSAVDGPPLHPHCLLPDTLVSACGPVAAISAWYDGPAVEIRTKLRALRVTGNHQILTDRGFVAAKALRQGDYVISGGLLEREILADPDDDKLVARASDCAGTFPKACRVAAALVPSAPEHIHGDGRFVDGHIRVVTTDRLLDSATEATLPKHLAQLPLGLRSGLAIGLYGCSDPASVLLRLSAAAHGIVCSTGESEALYAPSTAHSRGHGLAAIARHEAVLDHATPQREPIASDLIRKCLDGLSGLVTCDQVVNVRQFNYSGHVYDLQTESGLYVADGLIVSNCRCDVIPVLS